MQAICSQWDMFWLLFNDRQTLSRNGGTGIGGPSRGGKATRQLPKHRLRSGRAKAASSDTSQADHRRGRVGDEPRAGSCSGNSVFVLCVSLFGVCFCGYFLRLCFSREKSPSTRRPLPADHSPIKRRTHRLNPLSSWDSIRGPVFRHSSPETAAFPDSSMVERAAVNR